MLSALLALMLCRHARNVFVILYNYNNQRGGCSIYYVMPQRLIKSQREKEKISIAKQLQ